MQQLSIEHKKSTSKNQKTEPVENKREDHGRNIALTRKVFRIIGSDTFYCKSESNKEIYYFVRFNPSVFEYCSCPDNTYRAHKENTCKHIYAVIESIKKGTIIDVDKLPKEVKRDNSLIAKSYREDRYDF